MFVKELERLFQEIFKGIGYDLDHVNIIKSNRPELCDYQCDDVFKWLRCIIKTPWILVNHLLKS
jgi:hypothetical protein